MAKRFTDTEKYRKPFVRSLKGPYKLLWDYLYHDCDNAGIWIVDFEIAQIYLGADMKVNEKDALQIFNADQYRVHPFDGGKKWFIPSFIPFQYSKLGEKNPAHTKVISTLLSLGFLVEGIEDSKEAQRTFVVPPLGTMVKDMVVGTVVGEGKKQDTVKEKSQKSEKELSAIRVLEYYRDATGRKIQTDNRGWIKLVLDRFKEDITEQDLKDIVDIKVLQWTGGQFEAHLVPKTLFGDKHCRDYKLEVDRAKDKGLSATQIKNAARPSNALKTRDEMMEEFRIAQAKKYAQV